MSRSEKNAKSTLIYYFRLALAVRGDWDSDNSAEINAAVEDIIEAAQRPLIERIEALESKMEQIESAAEVDFSTKFYKPE